MPISRRGFVRSGGLALFSLGLDPLSLARAALHPFRLRPPRSASASPILVCLFQRGGVDGLNMIVPHGDAVYYRERPRIAIPRRAVIDLDGHFGLHPELASLRPWWDDRSLAVIHAVGSPHGTRSHVHGQEYLETHLARILAGTASVHTPRQVDPARYQPEHGAEYPPGRFGRALLRIAQLIKAEVGLEVAFADVGGWDTHFDQGAAEGRLAGRLRELAQGLAAFARDLGERMARVVALTMSEFGRTIRENGNSGTDHGHGTAMLVLGGPVAGGRVLGRWPGLEGRDLAVTTDFRDVFAEVLGRHPGARGFPGVIKT